MFDLDGTLIDSLGDLADSMNLALESFGFATHPETAYRTFVGDGVHNLVKRALPQDREHSADFVDEVANKMREIYASRWVHRTCPYDGVPELLTALNQKKIPLAILSNKPDGPTKEIAQLLLSDWTFDFIQGALPDVPIKPDPTSAIELAAKLGFPPGEIHYVGDTDTDMKTATGAGMIPVGVSWGFRDQSELVHYGAQIILQHPLDLLA